ncbi:pyridoxal phosphate-dependent aminotransferase [Desulfosporosinus nitroreducens]|uniref:pyridoxal phosphate-dependent aminotransferase n=1 Tax=Desulfosporosinus nitroreducens TaxID=2018668 RepID=UPI00207CB4D4|nr:pyridoxal phosphate-dependent aminotransferase [Desulfosporosinus nitroreducens]MCO1603819.1 pyridoxal phosphate-dependent aminotransferase [Desulfosporosinus nitroreducens]
MKITASNRLKNLMKSEIRIMSIECDKMGGINLSQGICDLPLAPALCQSAQKAMEDGINHYTRYDGLPGLRQAIAAKLWQYNKIQADPEKNIIVTCGATGALYATCLALFNPGDEVILFEPFYGYHEYTLAALDIAPVYVRLEPPAWKVDMEKLEQVVTKRTKGLLINTPANPSGKVFSRSELDLLADFCLRHDLFILTDEIYEYIVYDGLEHISPGSLQEIADRVITISGYSKTFSITGWRIGYSVCEEGLSNLIGCASDLVYVCAPAPLQAGTAEAIRALPGSFYKDLGQGYSLKRTKLCAALEEAKLKSYLPQGAYYTLADCSLVPGRTSKEKAMYVLAKTGVAAVPGNAFYHDGGGENLMRFCFAKSDDVLDEACERLRGLKL